MPMVADSCTGRVKRATHPPAQLRRRGLILRGTQERFDVNEDGLRFVSTVLGFLYINQEKLRFDPTVITADGRRYIEIEGNGQRERLIIDEVTKRALCIV